MSTKRTITPIVLSLLVLAGWTSPARAAFITVNFEAELDSASADLLGAGYGTGNILGSLNYDTGTTDTRIDPEVGLYAPASGSFSFSGGGNSGYMDNSSSRYTVEVNLSSLHRFRVSGIASTSSTNATDYRITDFRLLLLDFSETAFATDALPTTLDLGDFDVRNFVVNLLDIDDNFVQASYSVTSLSVSSDDDQVPVPAPATLLLLGLGLAGMGVALRRR